MKKLYEVIELTSCTVFWKELGVDIRNEKILEKAAEKWHEIEAWLEEHIDIDTYRPYDKGVWFLHRKDAMFFKLIWFDNIV
jgi:hypothetical protein